MLAYLVTGGVPVLVQEGLIRIWGDLDVRCGVAASLSEGTASVIVRVGTTYEVLINDTIEASDHATVVRHTIAQHHNGCYTTHCHAARGWLREPMGASLPISATA